MRRNNMKNPPMRRNKFETDVHREAKEKRERLRERV
jgi:hypothetical protein